MQEEARRFENTDGTTDPQGEFFKIGRAHV